MKFTKEIKEKIDFFFDNITPVELYALSIKKYGFIENIDINIDNQRFSTLSKSLYNSKYNEEIDLNKHTTMPFAA